MPAPGLQIGDPGAGSFDIISYIKHYTCEKVKYNRETNGQKGRVYKKQPYLINRNIKPFAQIGANPKGITFKKG